MPRRTKPAPPAPPPAAPPAPPPRLPSAGPPRKLYKIGEVMRYSGLSRQTLHNYTMMGLIHFSETTDSGHRLYDETVFDRIRWIEMLKRHRTLSEVKEMLAQGHPGKTS